MALPFLCHSQEFGGFPPSFQWQQINTDTVQIIFPKGLSQQANRVASIVHYVVKNNKQSIGNEFKKISIVLQNQTVLSNGYVGLGPFRSEFYLTALQQSSSLGSLYWPDLLALHEYRHVLQYANARKGFTDLMHIVNGQYGWAGAVGLSVPNWFMEGDAVTMETALSRQGRGRLPAFFNAYRSLWLSGRTFNYAKARNGSLKDYVPDHYPLGYLLCSYGRNTYGNNFWQKVYGGATAYRYIFYPFSRAIYHQTPEKLNVAQFYGKTMAAYHEKWKTALDTEQITPAQKSFMANKQGNYTTYLFPQFVSDSEIVVLKSTYKKIAAFYIINKKGKETRLTAQGYTTDNYFSYRNQQLCWSEYNFHERWGWYDYSIIKIYDIKTGQKRQITSRTKYFSPDLSPDGQRLVVAEATAEMEYSLKIIDAHTGKLLKKLPNPDSLYFSYPKWAADGQSIIAAARQRKGDMALVKIHLADSTVQPLIPFSNNIVGLSYPTENGIYFEASFKDVDNIYFLPRGDSSIQLVTNRTLGNYQPSISPSGKELVFSEFSAFGNDLYTMPLNSSGSTKKIQPTGLDTRHIFNTTAIAAENGPVLDKIEPIQYPRKKYRKTKALFNLHSWVPYVESSSEYGYEFYSDNVLNTLSIRAAGTYNNNERSFTPSVTATYGGLYTHIFAGGAYAFNRTGRASATTYYTRFDEGNLFAGLALPLNFTRSLFSRSLYLYSNYDYRQIASLLSSSVVPHSFNDLRYGSFNIQSIRSGLIFLQARKKAQQNIYSRFGQYIAVKNYQSIDGSQAAQWNISSEFSFPGLVANHNLVLQGAFQYQNYNSYYRYGNDFTYARGYGYQYATDHAYTGAINYHFPIAYPDAGLLGIIYFLRVRGNLFCDYSWLQYRSSGLGNTSLGAELLFDVKFFNAQAYSLGFRYTYRMDLPQNNMVEFFIPVKRL